MRGEHPPHPPPTARFFVAEESSEDRPEEGVHGCFVREDAPVREESRPRPALAVGMKPVDERHAGPEADVLELGREHPLLPPPAAHPLEGRTEHGAVRKVEREAGRPPERTAGDDRPEQAQVGIRRAEKPPRERFRSRPDGGRDDSCARSATHDEGFILPTWRR